MDKATIHQLGVSNALIRLFSKRASLISEYLRNAEVFVERVKKDESAIAFIESFAVAQLAHLGWISQAKEFPDKPPSKKREAVRFILERFGLEPLPSLLSNPQHLKASSKQDVQRALLIATRNVHQCLIGVHRNGLI